jgi:hypothetical protein
MLPVYSPSPVASGRTPQTPDPMMQNTTPVLPRSFVVVTIGGSGTGQRIAARAGRAEYHRDARPGFVPFYRARISG